jgi:hypothetical protein
MSSQVLGYLHAQEAARRWRKLPLTVSIAYVGPTMTVSIRSEPVWVRALYRMIATTAERSAWHTVRLLSDADARPANGVALFAKARNRRGRQLGRVLATRYGEIVTDQLFAGTVGLAKALIPLVEAVEQVLDLDFAKRQRTILRADSGGGALTTSTGPWPAATKSIPRITRANVRASWD